MFLGYIHVDIVRKVYYWSKANATSYMCVVHQWQHSCVHKNIDLDLIARNLLVTPRMKMRLS